MFAVARLMLTIDDDLRRKEDVSLGKDPPQTDSSEPIDALISRILESTPKSLFHLPDDKASIRQILFRLASYARALEKELNLSQNEGASHSSNDSPPASTETSPSADTTCAQNGQITSIADLSNQLAGFSIGLQKNIHFGESSQIALVMTAIDHRKELSLPEWQSILAKTRRPKFWTVPSQTPSLQAPSFRFPSADLLQRFVKLYFDEYDVYSPLLHRPTFEKSIAQGLHFHDSGFGALVLTVCTIGAGIMAQSHDDKIERDWLSQIPLEKMVFEHALSLYHLQMLILTIVYIKGPGMPQSNFAWVLTGIAIRAAQERGVHRLNIDYPQPCIQGELWRRVFWLLLVIDTRLSFYFGRPRATSSQDFDLGPLIECDDEYWETEDPQQAFKQPEGKPSLISYWNCYCRLNEIVGLAQSTILSVRKPQLQRRSGLRGFEWYEKMVMELDSALNQWADSVPDILRWETPHPNETIFSQSALLYTMYYCVQLQIHRHFIPRPGESSTLPFPSLAICTNAARSLINVCETHWRRRPIPYSQYLVFPLFTAAMVLAVNLWRAKGIQAKANILSNFDPNKEMAWIQRCIELIHVQESKFLLAGRMVDLIKTVVSASHTPFSTFSLSQDFISDQNHSVTETLTESTQGLHQQQAGIPNFDNSSNIHLPFYTSELGSFDPYTDLSQAQQDHVSGFVGFDTSAFGSLDSLSFAGTSNDQMKPLSSDGSLQDVNNYAPGNGYHGSQTDLFGDTSSNPLAELNGINISWPGDPSYAEDWNAFMRSVDQMLQNQTGRL
ncbi:hypothetical protein D9758_005104 [Tetrapyrgos nigripes]|uniref:Xylanolytic transcriptional activator regulatory domain-containing protein n=1 Tax=Tetrapyrgos nigripes TaxID=182062 RepID=A0A8H5GW95_9AGAR|nr:hypothetical protein D9758_005104 [Tetrapyrgos nigripes]